jgi:hypothetical protein
MGKGNPQSSKDSESVELAQARVFAVLRIILCGPMPAPSSGI